MRDRPGRLAFGEFALLLDAFLAGGGELLELIHDEGRGDSGGGADEEAAEKWKGDFALDAIGVLAWLDAPGWPPCFRHQKTGDRTIMAKYALYASLKAKPGKESDVEAFLKQGAEMCKDETETVTGTA